MRYRVLVTDRAWPDLDVERQILARADAEVIEAENADESTLLVLAPDVDAIAVCWAKLTPAIVNAAKRCRVISRLGIGLDNIPVELATSLGIPVTNVPDYCVDEVAEHTLAVLLSVARNLPFFHHRTKSGEYALRAAPPMHRLTGRTLGLVGLGRIGRAVATRARALGLNVLATTGSGTDGGTGCRMVSLQELLAESDWVSLHLPLSVDSRHLFRLREFETMRRTAWIINTSRGGLIDHAELWTALQRNLIAGAALDVFDPEPPDLSQPLFRDERVLVTPHSAFLSAESLLELRTRTANQIAAVLQGERPECVVNPEVFS